jgi:alkylhydroperoxidase family enzyme
VLNTRERAALRYVEEIARGGASDESFAALRACFSEREIVEITWLQAFTTYLIRMAQPLGIGSDGFCALQEQRR